MTGILSLDHITKTYGMFRAVSDVSLAVGPGECVGLVGESGSGKSTIVKCALRLIRPDAGSITYDGIDLASPGKVDRLRFRREVQLVFQDPYSSLNPRMTVAELVGEGLVIHRLEQSAVAIRERVAETLTMVGLSPDHMTRYPRAFSGGQRQRIAIARALAIRPRILVCDEPVSALDVSVQAQVINLLQDMQAKLGLGVLFVAHDLALVRHMCNSVLVLHRGTVVESGRRDEIFENPKNDYTKLLLEAVPIPDPKIAREKLRARRQRELVPAVERN